MLSWIRNVLSFLLTAVLALAALAAGVAWFVFRPGGALPDQAGEPLLGPAALEAVAVSDRPLGDILVAPDGRFFFTVHPVAPGDGPRLFEWVDGAARPVAWASGLRTPFALGLDGRNRLWVADPGLTGLEPPRLAAFDLESGALVHDHVFPRDVVPWGGWLNDLAVSADGNWVYLADAGVLSHRAALVVYNVRDGRSHRMLAGHETVSPRDYLIRAPGRDMAALWGNIALKPGVAGLSLGEQGEWLYYAAANHDTAYRVPVSALHNPNYSIVRVAVDIQTVGAKPIGEGVAAAPGGILHVTDVEHGALLRLLPDGRTQTILRDPRLRWPGALAMGPDGALYVADSALQEVLLRDPSQVAAAAPFTIWRATPPPPVPLDPLTGLPVSE